MFFWAFLHVCFNFLACESYVGLDFGSRNVVAGMIGGKFNNEIVQFQNGLRYIPSYVTLDGKRRYSGTESYGKFIKSSNRTFVDIINTVGKNELPNTLKFPFQGAKFHRNQSTDRFTFLDFQNSVYLFPEEIAATLIHHIEREVEIASGVEAYNYVIAIPPSFTQAQREALLDAAEIAHVNIIALLESNAASALWFGAESHRTLPYSPILPSQKTPTNHLRTETKQNQGKEPEAEQAQKQQHPQTSTEKLATKITSTEKLSGTQSILKKALSKFGLSKPKQQEPQSKKWTTHFTSSDEDSNVAAGSHADRSSLKKQQKKMLDGNTIFEHGDRPSVYPPSQSKYPDEVRPVFFVDVGAKQTTFSFVEFRFEQKEVVKMVKSSAPKEQSENSTAAGDETDSKADNSTSKGESSKTEERKVEERSVVRSYGMMDMRHVKTYDMLGGFRFDEPLLNDAVKQLCYVLHHKQYEQTANGTSSQNGENEEEEDEDEEMCSSPSALLKEVKERRKLEAARAQRKKKGTGPKKLRYGYRMDDFDVSDEVKTPEERLAELHEDEDREKEIEKKLREKCGARKKKDGKVIKQGFATHKWYKEPLCDEVMENDGVLIRLRREVEKGKEMLSVSPVHEVIIDDPMRGVETLTLVLNRSVFEYETAHLVRRVKRLAEMFVGEVKGIMPRLNVSTVPLVLNGGGTRIPAVQAALADAFQRQKSENGSIDENELFSVKKMNLDESPALGATIYSHLDRPFFRGQQNNGRARQSELLPGSLEAGGAMKLLRRSPRSVMANVEVVWNEKDEELFPTGDMKNETNEAKVSEEKKAENENLSKENSTASENGTETAKVYNYQYANTSSWTLFGTTEVVRVGEPFGTIQKVVIPLGNITLLSAEEEKTKQKNIRALWLKMKAEKAKETNAEGSEKEEGEEAEIPHFLPFPTSVRMNITYSDPTTIPTGVPTRLMEIKMTEMKRKVQEDLYFAAEWSEEKAKWSESYEEKIGTEKSQQNSKVDQDASNAPIPLGSILLDAAVEISFMFDKRGVLNIVDTQFSFANVSSLYEKLVTEEAIEKEMIGNTKKSEEAKETQNKEDAKTEQDSEKEESEETKVRRERVQAKRRMMEVEFLTSQLRALQRTRPSFVRLLRHPVKFAIGQETSTTNAEEYQELRNFYNMTEAATLLGAVSSLFESESAKLGEKEDEISIFGINASSPLLKADILPSHFGMNISWIRNAVRNLQNQSKNPSALSPFSSMCFSLTTYGCAMPRLSVHLGMPSITRGVPTDLYWKEEAFGRIYQSEEIEMNLKEAEESFSMLESFTFSINELIGSVKEQMKAARKEMKSILSTIAEAEKKDEQYEKEWKEKFEALKDKISKNEQTEEAAKDKEEENKKEVPKAEEAAAKEQEEKEEEEFESTSSIAHRARCIMRVSTENEIKRIEETIQQTLKWIENIPGTELNLTEITSKISTLRNASEAVLRRAEEFSERPHVLKFAEQRFIDAKNLTDAMKEKNDTETAAVIDEIVKDVKEWLAELKERQSNLTEKEEPILLVDDVVNAIKKMDQEIDGTLKEFMRSKQREERKKREQLLKKLKEKNQKQDEAKSENANGKGEEGEKDKAQTQQNNSETIKEEIKATESENKSASASNEEEKKNNKEENVEKQQGQQKPVEL
ncbi:putative hsp70 domain containing protein [Monocercomonoides exilis]|uniref:putative hsp70 domain containing protein n=1 Tax=Monocercomonoides exilis TaxID=2049356 RepID=UPI00355A60BB|nr:putative hsp70 domain containing protein [Monocercomonoides exilis]|eukprot:MONOS_11815.1-p1 / transcript=MONOS_11815.1 / gene=MONOS_11815 / organism=Monocercomonoides_exilis_PA203 / gene_product=hsp70 domain containing protein / transcript_product=hsp70 domain containing protein / location=Mono_scaffold00614:28717-33731(-) / protein_length=1653 / sequence_SO=supercontig / SO=protein_coding / is_pseudo=false